ncbi:hypothetical protein VYU27_001370 [Nannochloropsis oceanica]
MSHESWRPGISLLLHASVSVLHILQPRPQICCLLVPRCVVLFLSCLAPPSCYFLVGLENEHRWQLLLQVHGHCRVVSLTRTRAWTTQRPVSSRKKQGLTIFHSHKSGALVTPAEIREGTQSPLLTLPFCFRRRAQKQATMRVPRPSSPSANFLHLPSTIEQSFKRRGRD